jgi:hypothetical protein
MVLKSNYLDLDDIYHKLTNKMERYAPCGYSVNPKLYNLQVYEEGGFFKAHCDTLQKENHCTTLRSDKEVSLKKSDKLWD